MGGSGGDAAGVASHKYLKGERVTDVDDLIDYGPPADHEWFPPYSAPFRRLFPIRPDGEAYVPEKEVRQGFRVQKARASQIRGGKACWHRTKEWLTSGMDSHGVPHTEGQLKRTWEVIRDSSTPVYDMTQIDKYSKARDYADDLVGLPDRHRPLESTKPGAGLVGKRINVILSSAEAGGMQEGDEKGGQPEAEAEAGPPLYCTGTVLRFEEKAELKPVCSQGKEKAPHPERRACHLIAFDAPDSFGNASAGHWQMWLDLSTHEWVLSPNEK